MNSCQVSTKRDIRCISLSRRVAHVKMMDICNRLYLRKLRSEWNFLCVSMEVKLEPWHCYEAHFNRTPNSIDRYAIDNNIQTSIFFCCWCLWFQSLSLCRYFCLVYSAKLFIIGWHIWNVSGYKICEHTLSVDSCHAIRNEIKHLPIFFRFKVVNSGAGMLTESVIQLSNEK